MQLVVATASGAPTRCGKGPLELLDPRPLGEPAGGDHLGDGLGLAAAEPRLGKRDLHHERASDGHERRLGARSSRHHSTSWVSPSSRSISALKPSSSLARRCVGEPPRHAVDRPLRAVFDRQVGAHHPQQGFGQLLQARLDPAGDVEDGVGDVGLGGEDVGASDVGHADEVHRLLAVTEDQRRLAGGDPLHPANQDLGVERRGRPCAGRRR